MFVSYLPVHAFTMSSLFINQNISPLTHLLLVIGLLLLLLQPLSWQHSLPTVFWIRQGIVFWLLAGVFYLNMEIWVPRFLFENKTWWFIALNLCSVASVVVLVWLVDGWLDLPRHLQWMRPAAHTGAKAATSHSVDKVILMTTLFLLGTSTSIKVVQKWQKDAELRQQEALLRKSLEQQKTSSELSFLKAQINPHFFFNTLNNIYALTMINVESSREALLKLSRMMRYVLYETQKDAVLLSQEIAFIQNYIELMQLRLTDKVEITFRQPAPLKDITIAPMLLLPFVENAFKHGVSALQPSFIHIAIGQQASHLNLKVRNTLFSEKAITLDTGSGIGLVNTRRRLDLLYPERYHLSVTQNTTLNEYQVHLTVDIS